jgi:hypothetical protein
MTSLCATDLDRTLIYSRAALGDVSNSDLVPVERYNGADAAWMTARAAADWVRLAERACVVPVTTRTPAQWQRIALPGRGPRWVVAANGGVLLVDGVADERWTAQVRTRLSRVAPIDEVWRQVTQDCSPEWTTALRTANDFFCYPVVSRERLPADFVATAAAWAAARGWRVSLQGRKLYWVPEPLTKSAAVAEIAQRAECSALLAAGDSLLDADLLAAADAGIAARHGELVASGWRAPHVRVTEYCGVRAGEEIVRWLLTTHASLPGVVVR